MKRRMLVFIMILLLAAASGCAAPASRQKSEGYWPDEWRTSSPEEQGMDSQMLADMINSIQISGKSVNSVTVIRNGFLVNETYFYPYQKGYRHALNSDTKSILSALVGIAIEEGHIGSVDDKVLDYFPGADIANVDARKKDMTIRDLLTMRTGLDWQFDGNVSTGEMLQSPDWTKFTLDLPMREEPGQSFNYCNGAANVISAVIQKTTGKTAAEYAEEKLAPLGMDDIFWSAGPEGVSAGYSGIYMSPDDMAKFGYLYLRNGLWNGQQIIPQGWVEESTKQQTEGGWVPLFPGYGYMWWMNRFGGYSALAHGGNYIFVVPEKDLVVVFTGGIFDYQDMFYPGELMEQYIIPAVKSDSVLGPNQAAEAALRQAAEAAGEPKAEPVSCLPPIAAEISGKPIELSNEGGSTVLTVTFNGGSEFTVDSDGIIKKVGLDGIYRVSKESNVFGTYTGGHKALKGSWINENTLQVVEQDLEDGFITVYTACFDNGVVILQAEYNLGFKLFFTGNDPR